MSVPPSRREARPRVPVSASWRVRFGRGVRGRGCRVWSAAGPPPFSLSSPLRLRAPASAAAVGGPRAFCLFPDRLRDLVCTGGGTRSLPGRWPGRARSPRGTCRSSPRRGSPALTVPGWLCRVRGWGGAGAAGGLARPAPPSGPRVSAPLLSGYLALAFRRGGLKTPGGSPYRPRGRGGGGARRDVGRLREGFPVPPHVRRSLRLSGPPLRPPALPEAAVRGGVSRAPSGRPRGSRPERLACPAGWRAAAGRRVRGVPCPVCPAFPSPTRFFFFLLTCVSFRFSLAGLRRSPLAVGPLSSRAGGAGGGACCRRQHPCESAHTPDYRYDS